MIEQEFVPYQESLELKALGFDEPCFGWYASDKSLIKEYIIIMNLKAPTFSQAFRWFREKHKLMFQIFYLRNGNHAALIHKTTPEYMDMIDQIRPSGCLEEVVDCYSYEEAEFECLKKLIKIVKNNKS